MRENSMRFRHFKLTALALTALLVVAACGDDDDEGAGDTTTTSTEAGGTTTAAPAANAEEDTGTVNVMSAGEPEEVAAYQTIFDDMINSQTDYEVEIESVGS